MRLDSGTSLQQEVGWDRPALRMVRYLADSQSLPFTVCSLSALARQVRRWRLALPRVQPFHELGCNNMKEVLSLLASMDIKFEVSTKQQMGQLADSGLPMNNAIFNNPLKLGSHIRAAASSNITTTTFDTPEELKKIKKNAPDSRLLLHLACDEETIPSSQLGQRHGADLNQVEDLLVLAQKLGLSVVGVILTMGNDQDNQLVRVKRGLQLARRAFDTAAAIGSDLDILHLGDLLGLGDLTQEFTTAVSHMVEEAFPIAGGVEIAASAGRFLSTPAVTLAVQVIGVRQCRNTSMNYIINEGVFGAFASNLTGDKMGPAPFPLGGGKNRKGLRARQYDTKILGPSGDELDTITEDIVLPQLSEGDWLLFPNMGHYHNPDLAPLHNGQDFVIYIKSRAVFPEAKPCPGLQDGWVESCTSVDLDPELDLDVLSGARGEIDLTNTFIYG